MVLTLNHPNVHEIFPEKRSKFWGIPILGNPPCKASNALMRQRSQAPPRWPTALRQVCSQCTPVQYPGIEARRGARYTDCLMDLWTGIGYRVTRGAKKTSQFIPVQLVGSWSLNGWWTVHRDFSHGASNDFNTHQLVATAPTDLPELPQRGHGRHAECQIECQSECQHIRMLRMPDAMLECRSHGMSVAVRHSKKIIRWKAISHLEVTLRMSTLSYLFWVFGWSG